MKAVNKSEVNLKDLELRSYKEHGLICEKAPVSGHNFTGLVERKIKTVQDAFKMIDLANKRLHATGLQTLAKLIENDINNVPLGFSYGRDADNTPLLKLITPNLLKIGRLHSRALDGPVRFPAGPKDLMVKVKQLYKAFFKVWNATMVPKLLPQPKWFKESPELKPGDIIYFMRTSCLVTGLLAKCTTLPGAGTVSSGGCASSISTTRRISPGSQTGLCGAWSNCLA